MRARLAFPTVALIAASLGSAAAQTGSAADQAPYVGPADNRAKAPGQGAQDPARSEFVEGHTADMHKCMATLIARREKPDEARVVCNKIISGIGE